MVIKNMITDNEIEKAVEDYIDSLVGKALGEFEKRAMESFDAEINREW